MTNSKNEHNQRLTRRKKEVNPFTLPSNAQLLAYWQYRNNAKQPPDTWRVRHTWIEEDPRDEKERLEDERKRNINSGLVKQLRENSAQAPAFSKSRYVRDIRLLSIRRLLLGQKRDGCIQLDQQLDIEYQKYLQLKREYKECVNALEEFLSRDHEESMRILNIADAELSLTTELSERRDELSRRYGQARLEVYHWEEAWRTVRACHRFLHQVSPLSQLNEDDNDDDEIVNHLKKEKSDATLQDGQLPKVQSAATDMGHPTSLDSLIAAFEKEAIGMSKSEANEPSKLGLVEANDLLKLFRDIELQNLNALIHLESLNGPMSDMITRIESAEVQVNDQIDDVLEHIKQLEKSIEIEERRAQRLERKANHLVQRQFRALICSESALRARVLVEEAYESCVEANEAGLEPLALANTLENMYERLSAELDSLPRDLVQICERDGFRQEMRETREAEEAGQKYELMHRLLAALRRIMEQTKEPGRRKLMKRSLPRANRRKKKIDDLTLTSQPEPEVLIDEICKRKDSIDYLSDDGKN